MVGAVILAMVRAATPAMVRAVTPAMDATGALSRINTAMLGSSYQALPSSSVALQFLLGLKGREVISLQGWEGTSAASWFWLTSIFQDERRLVDSRRGGAIWTRPNCQVVRFNRCGSLALEGLQ
ncbi:hypothetical protein Pyn_24314 [Prunus yedoensis var. nudiflora]|uniref:Uncharacterized protein n=1 Tax=Prunus yedoensis var. nudiflora TaxID=2094558 RepID=A0A314Z0W2_PRUYE|nr:hypothetical protein Pyn_24314 [Prunus yedoensis var. nudiflora]